MFLEVSKTSWLEGKVAAPPSKSYTHRALLIASLAEGKSKIYKPLKSKDTLATKNFCEAIGAKIIEKNNCYEIYGTSGRISPLAERIDVMNSGTTLRLITSLLSLSKKEVLVDGDDSIRKRPMKPLLEVLKKHSSIKYLRESFRVPFKIKQKDRWQEMERVKVDASISSQFLSSLLILAPLIGLEIEILGEMKSKPYVDITLEMLEVAGIKFEVNGNLFIIEKQSYKPFSFTVPGDFSSAANILCPAAMIPSRVEVENLSLDTKQGDKIVVKILEDMGAKIRIKENSIAIEGSKLNAITLNAANIPDLVPVLVSVACYAKGTSIFTGVEHLRYKECDRLKACEEFKKLGANLRIGKDFIEVKGKEKLKGSKLKAFKDHRMVMALASAALNAEGTSLIDSAEMLEISFPDYLAKMKKLGANMSIKLGKSADFKINEFSLLTE